MPSPEAQHDQGPTQTLEESYSPRTEIIQEAAEEVEEASEAPHGQPGNRVIGSLAIESVRLSEALPSIDWQAAQELIPQSKVSNAKKAAEFIPSMASVVANHYNREVPVTRPTGESIRAKYPDLNFIHTILSFFPFGWGDAFDRFLVGRAMAEVNNAATRFVRAVDAIDKVAKPKEEFVDEIDNIYKELVGQQDRKVSPKQLHRMVRTAHGQGKRGSWYSAEKFPLIHGLLSGLELPDSTMASRRHTLKAVTPEVRQGLEVFLEAQGKEIIHTPVSHRHKSLNRRIAERLADGRLKALPNELAQTLEKVYSALPVEGIGFKQDIQQLAQRIGELSSRGYSAHEITDTLLEDLRSK